MARTAQSASKAVKKLGRRSTTAPARKPGKAIAKPATKTTKPVANAGRAPIKARRAGAEHANDVTIVYEGPGRRFEIHRGTNAKGGPCWYAVETIREGDTLHEAIVLPSHGHALETCHGWIRSRGHSK